MCQKIHHMKSIINRQLQKILCSEIILKNIYKAHFYFQINDVTKRYIRNWAWDRQNVPDSKLPQILLKIGHIIHLSMGNWKMEFANHFSKIHPLVLPHTMYFRCQIQITVDVNSFEVSWMADSTDMKDDIWLSKKWTQNCLHQQKCESDT